MASNWEYFQSPAWKTRKDKANQLRDRIYAALHEGTNHEWAVAPPD